MKFISKYCLFSLSILSLASISAMEQSDYPNTSKENNNTLMAIVRPKKDRGAKKWIISYKELVNLNLPPLKRPISTANITEWDHLYYLKTAPPQIQALFERFLIKLDASPNHYHLRFFDYEITNEFNESPIAYTQSNCVFLNQEMIPILMNPDSIDDPKLAQTYFILAHEIAHAVHDHTYKRSTFMKAPINLFQNDPAYLEFCRETEKEADLTAAFLGAASLGINSLTDILHTDGEHPTDLTHPSLQERIRYLREWQEQSNREK
jgi:hypothetical protein